MPLEPADDPDSGLFGFVGPEGLIGLFALPPIDEPLIVEPRPELPVKPGEVDPDVPAEGLLGAVVASPGAVGAVAASPVFALPPIVAPPPAAPAPPPPAPPPAPCA